MGALSGDMPAPSCCERYQASGKKQHQPHDQQPVDELEILRGGEPDQIVDAVENEDTDDRAADRGDPAEQRKNNCEDREVAAENIVGIEHRHVPSVNAA